MRRAPPLLSLLLPAALFAGCGSSSPATTPSPRLHTGLGDSAALGAGNVFGSLTTTVDGRPVSGAALSAAGVSTRSAGDGSFAMRLPPGLHRLTISGPGIVERTTTIRAPAEGVRLDAIPESGPWTLAFYREIARNGTDDLLPLTRWDSEPRFFIDTRPEPTTGAEIPEETVAFVREAIRVTLPLLSGGRLTGEHIEATPEPPADMTPGTVILRWNAAEVSEFADTADAFAFRVGGPANVVVFRHLSETWAVHHEIGHVMGLFHPVGGHRPSHMWYSGELEPPHFTEWDIFHARVLYARPAGNTDVDVDPTGFVPGSIAGSVSASGARLAAASQPAFRPVVCSFPDANPARP